MDILNLHGWLGTTLFIWVALSIGSFLNVVIYRLPVMLENAWRSQARELLEVASPAEAPAEPFNLMTPRSRCPQCNHAITAWENIPLLSWIWLRGRCRACRAPIPLRYPGIELLTGLLSLAVINVFGPTTLGLYVLVFTWLLIAATFIDYDTTLLPDQLTYPLLWLGLICNAFSNGLVNIEDALVGAIAGYLVLWGVYWGFKLATGKEGMGYGDFKLLAALGAWLGWQALPGVILIAAVSGLAYALTGMLRASLRRSDPIPFGPFLSVAGWVTLMFRDTVLAFFTP